MRTNIRNGGTLECDYPGCKKKLTTYSLAAMVREQAKVNEGWNRVFRWQIEDDAAPDELVDVCAKHAKVAEAGTARRAEQLAAARAEAKAERDQLRSAKREIKSAERAARKSAKAAERAIARAKKKAQKLENKIRGAEVHVVSVEPA